MIIYAIDDEENALEYIVRKINEAVPEAEVYSFSDPAEALKKSESLPFDVAFLDIQMPDLNGLELSRIVGDKCRIIFTTAFERYALESYKVNALDYLLKPIAYTDFLEAANKALEWFDLKNKTVTNVAKKSILVKSDYKLIQIDFDKIHSTNICAKSIKMKENSA